MDRSCQDASTALSHLQRERDGKRERALCCACHKHSYFRQLLSWLPISTHTISVQTRTYMPQAQIDRSACINIHTLSLIADREKKQRWRDKERKEKSGICSSDGVSGEKKKCQGKSTRSSISSSSIKLSFDQPDSIKSETMQKHQTRTHTHTLILSLSPSIQESVDSSCLFK